jgi:hypothetical protein
VADTGRPVPPAIGGGSPAGGGLGQRFLGMPAWAWLGLAVAAGVGVFLWRSRASAQASAGQPAIQVVPDNTTGQLVGIDSLLRDIQGFESQEIPQATTTPPPSSTLGAIPNLKVTATRSTATATWDKVDGALWYTAFWRNLTTQQSTGGYKTFLTESTADLGKLNIQSGQTVGVLVYASKSNDERGPDATASAKVP